MKSNRKGNKTTSRALVPERAVKGATPDLQPAPDVILDVVFDDGLFFIEIRNIGTAPATDVKTKFDTRFSGPGGERDLSRLPLFRHISFLAPGRTIRTFLDTSTSYFQRNQPLKITATVSWHDKERKRFSTTIKHDLTIYKDIIIALPAWRRGPIEEE